MDLPENKGCYKENKCPFNYIVALASQLKKQKINFSSQENFTDSIATSIKKKQIDNDTANFLYGVSLHPVTSFSHNFLQMWFHPIIDYSIPQERIYNLISACELLKTCKISSDKQNLLYQITPNSLEKYLTNIDAERQKNEKNSNFLSVISERIGSNKKIVIIAPGAYKDSKILPLSIAYRRNKNGLRDFFYPINFLTGGEIHAYAIHHYLNRDLVIPIPDCVTILLISILGKFIRIKLLIHPDIRKILSRYSSVLILTYVFSSTIISLQIYVTARILIPWLLPSITLWNYIRLEIKKYNYVQTT
ncbi:MAG: hypothetical protein AAF349_14985 [Cyanobacteria bacterium P01_A01_bin.68]